VWDDFLRLECENQKLKIYIYKHVERVQYNNSGTNVNEKSKINQITNHEKCSVAVSEFHKITLKSEESQRQKSRKDCHYR
jgi:hypothetical protein